MAKAKLGIETEAKLHDLKIWIKEVAQMPELAKQEFADRVQKVRGAIAQRGLDALVIFSDMRAIGGGNSFYLSIGTWTSRACYPVYVVDEETSPINQRQ